MNRGTLEKWFVFSFKLQGKKQNKKLFITALLLHLTLYYTTCPGLIPWNTNIVKQHQCPTISWLLSSNLYSVLWWEANQREAASGECHWTSDGSLSIWIRFGWLDWQLPSSTCLCLSFDLSKGQDLIHTWINALYTQYCAKVWGTCKESLLSKDDIKILKSKSSCSKQ